MSEELRPCPFCGGKAKVKAAKEDYIGFTVWCACNCGARTGGFCPDMSKEDDTIENIEESKIRAIKAWNRRASNGTDYDVDKVVEQLKTDSSVKVYGSGNSDNYLIPVKRAIEIVKAGGIDER